jgi:hypothetical protein
MKLLGSVVALLSVMLTLSALAHEAPKTDAAKQKYIDEHIRVFDVESRYFSTLLNEDGLPGVQYAVKNFGPETVVDLEVTFYVLDKLGMRFGESTFHPLLTLFDKEPLKPNYTRRTPKDKVMSLGELGDEWSGRVEYEVTDIEFAD